VLRQAPLLRALRAAGAKVAAVRDASAETSYFGVPFLVVERLPERPLIMGPDAGPSWLPVTDRQHAHNLAAEQLAAIHALDVSRHLNNWEQAKTLRKEIDFWADILPRGRDAGWTATGMRLREHLLASLPADTRTGVCHGDFQTNNVLFTDEGASLKVTGVVDWEVASIGATDLDIAWFLMMNDAAAWHPVEQRGGLNLPMLIDAYQKAASRITPQLEWYWAFACFRMASIAALNIRLHRSGRRPDESWERAVSSMPILFERGAELLGVRL
jgi:aminoglycoside phosphotransferase (APT) family kinase protein